VRPRAPDEAWPRRALAALLGRYERRIARSVDCTIVASEWVRRDLEALGIDRVAHVPLGVDLDLHHPRRRAWAAATRRRHGLPAGPLVLYLGRFSREKGIDRLLDAWPAVRRRTGASLALVGDVPGALPMPERSGLGVHLVPFVRDRHLVADLHAAADVMVSPGCCETFGLAALEALASGTPVVAADQGGVGELVRRSGAGRTFHAPDPVDLAAQLEALLDDGPATPGARGRAYAEAEHDWDVVFDRLFGVYDRLVAT
jgi:alpha-1,6-mannosyltransferase